MFDLRKLGGGMAATSVPLLTLGGNKVVYWLGFAFAIVGPLLLSLKTRPKKPKP